MTKSMFHCIYGMIIIYVGADDIPSTPIPNIDITASVTPNSTIEAGNKAFIRCRVRSNTIDVNKVAVYVQFENTKFHNLEQNSSLHHVGIIEYYLELDDLIEEEHREYTCIGEIYEYCIKETDVISLDIIINDYGRY